MILAAWILAVMLLMPASGEEDVAAVADFLSPSLLRMTVLQLTSEECDIFFLRLTHPSEKDILAKLVKKQKNWKPREIETMDDCVDSNMEWYEENGDTADISYFLLALQDIGRGDLAKDLMETLGNHILSELESFFPEEREKRDKRNDLMETLGNHILSELESIFPEEREKRDKGNDLMETLGNHILSELESIFPEEREKRDKRNVSYWTEEEIGELLDRALELRIVENDDSVPELSFQPLLHVLYRMLGAIVFFSILFGAYCLCLNFCMEDRDDPEFLERIGNMSEEEFRRRYSH